MNLWKSAMYMCPSSELFITQHCFSSWLLSPCQRVMKLTCTCANECVRVQLPRCPIMVLKKMLTEVPKTTSQACAEFGCLCQKFWSDINIVPVLSWSIQIILKKSLTSPIGTGATLDGYSLGFLSIQNETRLALFGMIYNEYPPLDEWSWTGSFMISQNMQFVSIFRSKLNTVGPGMIGDHSSPLAPIGHGWFP